MTNSENQAERLPFGIYIHWPYCARKCPYCDFNSCATDRIPHAAMRDAYLAHLDLLAGQSGSDRLVSVYLGGGTPSLMRPDDVGLVLAAIRRRWSLEDVEITSEANPVSASADWLYRIRAAGVNRLSLGVQSFDDDVLRFLGRLHNAREAHAAIERTRRAGFDNLSVDLILGSRPSSVESAARDIEQALQHAPEHISAYTLTIEEPTPFGKRAALGECLSVDDNDMRAELALCMQRLEAAGYEHYEVSNYARAGKRSRHNLLYWSGARYLGIGPGAHGYEPETAQSPAMRYANIAHPDAYIERLMANQSPVSERETLSRTDIMRETIMTGLRRLDGIGESEFLRRTGAGLQEVFGQTVARLIARGFLAYDSSGPERCLRVTPQGFYYLDDIILDFF